MLNFERDCLVTTFADYANESSQSKIAREMLMRYIRALETLRYDVLI